jgi:hypothetical protein
VFRERERDAGERDVVVLLAFGVERLDAGAPALRQALPCFCSPPAP